MRVNGVIFGAIKISALMVSLFGSTQPLSSEVNNQQAIAEGEKLYQQHCQVCHNSDRLGAMGPALIPANLSRLRPAQAAKVIANGSDATQMPAFSEALDDKEIQQLVEFIYSPPTITPTWNEEQIKQSHKVLVDVNTLADKPQFTSDPLNLFVVVEQGDHHVSVLDGDTFERLARFKSHFALHGGPKYSSDGRFVYFGSRDGWISKYDLYNLKMVAEIRAGINTRNIAISTDGNTVITANYLPHTLSVLNADDLSLRQIINIEGRNGNSSRASAVYTAPPRQSFIVALKDVKEVWEIPFDSLTPRAIVLQDYLDDFFFDPDYTQVMGTSRAANQGQVVDLDSGKVVATLDIAGMPHLGSGITWDYGDTQVLASPNLQDPTVSIIDMKTWKTIKRVDTLGPGFFMRSHEKSPYAWTDVFFGPNKDVVHVIDKSTLEMVKTLRPVPGKTAAHVEFDRYGKYVLLSVSELDGEVIVYDANTFDIVKRLPMSKPSGKYNVYNKINFERGTSH